MRPKISKKKLIVNKQTIANLNPSQMVSIKAGYVDNLIIIVNNTDPNVCPPPPPCYIMGTNNTNIKTLTPYVPKTCACSIEC